MRYEPAPDLQVTAEEISKLLFPHIKLDRVKCFRSFGTSSRGTIARCHTIRKLMQRAIGLIFQKRENAEILLFEFAKSTKTPIHSMLVFFPFFAVWLDGKSRIVDIKVVPPFTISVVPKQEFVKLIEIPLSQKYSSLTEIFPRR